MIYMEMRKVTRDLVEGLEAILGTRGVLSFPLVDRGTATSPQIPMDGNQRVAKGIPGHFPSPLVETLLLLEIHSVLALAISSRIFLVVVTGMMFSVGPAEQTLNFLLRSFRMLIYNFSINK